jgi:hypothetical protein
MPTIFFYFLKIIFEISTSKWFENIKNILLQSKKKKKKFKFFEKCFPTAMPNALLIVLQSSSIVNAETKRMESNLFFFILETLLLYIYYWSCFFTDADWVIYLIIFGQRIQVLKLWLWSQTAKNNAFLL